MSDQFFCTAGKCVNLLLQMSLEVVELQIEGNKKKVVPENSEENVLKLIWCNLDFEVGGCRRWKDGMTKLMSKLPTPA